MKHRAAVSVDLQPDLRLHILPAFKDNYLYVLEQPTAARCAAIDPGDGNLISEFLLAHDLTLSHILLTHHHRDHTGGVGQLLNRKEPPVIVCSDWLAIPDSWSKPQVQRISASANYFEFLFNTPMRVLDVRGHTLDHVAFVFFDKNDSSKAVDCFVGDALFGAGCGGLFEGTYAQMFAGLERLRQLPPDSRLWCAHEYTLKNLRAAVQLGEMNPKQQIRLDELSKAAVEGGLEDHEIMTIPLKMSEEIETNPFLRWDSCSLQKAIDSTDSLETFTRVRQFRDRF